MSELASAPFIPATAPKNAVLDFSGALSNQELTGLETLAAGLKYKAKVVILPKDFSPGAPDQFAQELARQWHVRGDRFLLIIDLKGHKVKGIAGRDLSAAGINSNYLNRELFPQEFIPYIRQGDLSTAIMNTLTGIDGTVKQKVIASEGRSPANSSAVPSSPSGDLSFSLMIGVFIVMIASIFGMVFKSRLDKNKQLFQRFTEKIGPLYEKADQIAQAAEYLDRDSHFDLAQRVATFFNRLTVLEKAQFEVNQLMKKHKVFRAADGILNCHRLVDILDSEADQLLSEVNSKTGGVERIAPPAPSTALTSLDGEGAAVEIPERFRRPAWTLEPAYAPPVVMGGGSGVLDMMLLLNMMETNRRLDQLNWQMHHQQYQQPMSPQEDSSWDTNPAAGSNWLSWDDNSGAGDFDVGGGFDAGGGDW